MPWPTYRERKTINVESARPGAGRQRETKVAENGSSVTAANGCVRTPSTSTSNREMMRVSRTNSPCAAPVDMSPALPLMAKVDSSTRVTTPELESSWVTGPAKFHGSAIRLPYRLTWSLGQFHRPFGRSGPLSLFP